MHESRSAKITATVLALLAVAGWIRLPAATTAAPVTFSGSVSYAGPYSADTLYVAVLDTTGADDVTLLDLAAIPMSGSSFPRPYSLSFDNETVASTLLIAGLLDVDGGGVDSISGSDVFGWYAGTATPVGVSAASSQSGLDFGLPRAEIQGTVTLAAGQTEARIDVSTDPACILEGFRPGTFAGAGPYSIIGIYPGTYCVSAEGQATAGYLHVCHGDPTCASPSLITLGADEVRTGVDLDFSVVSVERVSFGKVKVLYR